MPTYAPTPKALAALAAAQAKYNAALARQARYGAAWAAYAIANRKAQ